MLRFHSDVFQKFPRSSAQIRPNEGVTEGYPKDSPTRHEWAVLIIFLMPVITVLLGLFYWFLG